jgi:hypothetical protein
MTFVLLSIGNLALNRPAFQSSTKSVSYETAASAAVDGNRDSHMKDGNSCTHTNYDHKAWWAVDLGAYKSIGSVTITNRRDCCRKLLSSDIAYMSTVLVGVLPCNGNLIQVYTDTLQNIDDVQIL